MKKQASDYNTANILIATRVKEANFLQYQLHHAHHHYSISYEHGSVRVQKDGEPVFFQQISHQTDEVWDDYATVAYLQWIKQAICNGTLEALKLPGKDEILFNE